MIGIINPRGILGHKKLVPYKANMIIEINENNKEDWYEHIFFGAHLWLIKEGKIAVSAQSFPISTNGSIRILIEGKKEVETWMVKASNRDNFPLAGIDGEPLILPMTVRPFTEEEKLIKGIIE